MMSDVPASASALKSVPNTLAPGVKGRAALERGTTSGRRKHLAGRRKAAAWPRAYSAWQRLEILVNAKLHVPRLEPRDPLDAFDVCHREILVRLRCVSSAIAFGGDEATLSAGRSPSPILSNSEP
jgi:hypothetical protein